MRTAEGHVPCFSFAHNASTHQEPMMSNDEPEDLTVYDVVLNVEEQYSIWPAHREPPLGWRRAGKRGLKSECLAHIEDVWTDMRPLSLRRQMEAAGL
jgi:MbtH protein